MRFFKKKSDENTKKLSPFKKWIARIGVVAMAIAATMIPATQSVFAEQITKNYLYYYVDLPGVGTHFDEPMFTWNGTPTYCIQPASHMPGPLGGGTGTSVTTADVFSKSSLDSFTGLTASQKKMINAISYYGYGYTGRSSYDYYFAAQALIWEQCGQSSYWYDHESGVNAAKSQIMASVNAYYSYTTETPYFKMVDTGTGQTVSEGSTINFGNAREGVTYKITDTKGVLSKYKLTTNDFGSRATLSGNTLTVTVDSSDYGVTRTLQFKQTLSADIDRGESCVIYSASYQNQFVVGNLIGSGTSSIIRMTGIGQTVDISKQDTNGGFISGSTLALYKVNGSTSSFVKRWTSTGSNTELNLVSGTYKLVEEDAPKGYYLSQPVTFTVGVKPYETQYFKMTDETLNIGISKVGATTGEAVENAHLVMKDRQNNIIYEWDTHGEYTQIPSNLLKAGETYHITETYNPPGYFALADEVIIQIPLYKPATSELNSAGYKVYNVLDEEIDYRVDKVDADTQEEVIGATMQIKDSNGTVIDEWVTDGNEHRIPKEKLEVGKNYTVHEVSAPAGYYVMATDISFSVSNTARGTYRIYAEDRAIQVNITKVDDDGYTVEGATLRVVDTNGDEVCRWTTENGSEQIKGLMDGETYYIEELAAAQGYYVTTTKQEFTVKATNATAQAKGQSIEFANAPIEYYVQKVDSKTKTNLAGAEIQVIEDGALDDEGNEKVVATVTTSDEGSVMIPSEALECGKTYRLHESVTIDGYYYATKDQTFTVPSSIEEAKKLKKTEFTFTVEDQKIELNVVKLDSETNEYVGGAQLAIFDTDKLTNEDGSAVEPLYQWETDADEPFKISDYVTLKAGQTYYLREMETATGYYLSEAVVSVELPTNISSGNKTLTATFENIPIKWHIAKVDENSNVLTTSEDGSYFTLEVYDTNETLDNNDDDTLITTLETNDKDYKSNGYFDMQEYINQGLVVGGHHYRIKEASAANGWRIADDTIVEIQYTDENDTLVRSSVTDEQIHVGIKKVDENGNLLTTVTTIENDKKVTKGFELSIYDEETNELVLTVDTSDEEYATKGYVDISNYLSAQKSYIVKETAVPVGYYQAKDYSFTVDSLTYEAIDGVNVGMITMIDPTIYAQFRKEDKTGNVIFGADGEGFIFQIYNTNGTDDTSDDTVVATFNTLTAEHNDAGWISIGQYLQEATTYRIHECYAPGTYKTSSQDAYITTPGYYVESQGSVQNVVIQFDED